MRSSTTADAPPPPLQMDAVPAAAPSASRPMASAPTMRAPLMPMGWPSDTAPPRRFTVARSSPRICAFASATTEKASFTSCRATSPAPMPAAASALGTASAGATVKSTGARCASPKPTTAASGSRPRALAAPRDMTTSAAAPSFSLLALPAVTVPSFLNADRRDVSLVVSFRGSSSSSTTTSPFLDFTVTGAISFACSALAARARAYDSSA
mmetsp:Transcript_24983/g.74977  ORF Transcript_24983/g.74977 Transcript_24983/m.74977 type:complete len:211 (+) Transcript_24983:86-718(+)